MSAVERCVCALHTVCRPEMLVRCAGGRVDEQNVEVAPAHTLHKLLDDRVLLRPPPHDLCCGTMLRTQAGAGGKVHAALTASLGFVSRNPMDMTSSPGQTVLSMGSQPVELWNTSLPCSPVIMGTLRGVRVSSSRAKTKKKRLEGRTRLGPQRSTSSSPTFKPLFARLNASCTETVLLPTPPLPDNTRTQCLKGMMM